MRINWRFKSYFFITGLLICSFMTGQQLNITYTATVRTHFTEVEKEEFMKDFQDKEMAAKQLEMNMFPEPVGYRLSIYPEMSSFQYLPKIKNSQDPDEPKILKVPSGINPIFSLRNGTFIQEEEIYGRNYQIVDSLKVFEIQNIQPAESVLGFTTFSAETHKDGVYYQILYTSDLPAEFGPDYFRIKEGLMLKVSFSKPEWKSEIEYEAVAKHFENKSKKSAIPKLKNMIRMADVEPLYEETEARIQEMNSGAVETD